MNSASKKNSMFQYSGLFFKRLNYKPSDDCKKKSAVQTGVDKFIQQQGQVGVKLQAFKQILDKKLRTIQQGINIQTLQTLWQSFRWLFSPLTLPTPIQMFLFCKMNQIDPTGLKKKDWLDIDQQTKLSVVYQAMYQSVAYAQPYLSDAFNQVLDIQASFDQSTLKQMKHGGSSFSNSFIQAMVERGKNLVSGAKKTLQWILFDDTQFNAQIILAKLKKVKVYGSMLIDCHQIQQCGTAQSRNDVILFTIFSLPSLRFRFINGSVIIYHYQNNVLKQVPPRQFNLDFLKSLFKQKAIQNAGDIVRSYNNYFTKGTQIMDNKKQFIKKYLS